MSERPDQINLYVSPHSVVALLNQLVETDPEAMHDLVEQRVLCNTAMADHPTVQVVVQDDYQENPDEEPVSVNTVGILGIINGIFGVDSTGWGCIQANFDEGRLIGFEVRESSFDPTDPLADLRGVVALRQRHERAMNDLRPIARLLLDFSDSDPVESQRKAEEAGVLFDENGDVTTLRGDFVRFLTTGISTLSWERVYTDDVPGIPNLSIFTARSNDNGCRIYGVHGRASHTFPHTAEQRPVEANDYVEVFNFQAGDPRRLWNGMTSTAWMEIIKHHLASFASPRFRYREHLPGARWTARAISALEDAGNALRQRLRYRMHAGIFGPPGSLPEMDALGNPLPEALEK